MTRVATTDNESTLLEQARLTTASQLERICREYAAVLRAEKYGPRPLDESAPRSVSRRHRDDGMVEVRAILPPEEAALVWAALDRVGEELCGKKKATVDKVPDANASAWSTNAWVRSTNASARSTEAATRSTESTRPTNVPSGESDNQSPDRSTPSASTRLNDIADAVADPTASTSSYPTNRSRPIDSATDTTALNEVSTTSTDVSTAIAMETLPACVTDVSISVPNPDFDARFLEELAWSPRRDPTYKTVPASWYEEDDRTLDEPTFTSIRIADIPKTSQVREFERSERRKSFDRADALVAMATAVVRGGCVNRSPTEVLMTVSHETLVSASSEPTQLARLLESGAAVPAETARRLCCDAGLVTIVENANGDAISIGRKSRTIPGSMKRALLKRDRTCTFPGCTTRVFLEGHHVRHWALGGKTEMANLCSLCTYHHRFVHEYRYTIEMMDTGPVFRDSNGTLVPLVAEPPALADLGWPALYELNADLDITSETIEYYDGEKFSYSDLIDYLVRADRL